MERSRQQAARMYEARGIAREGHDGRTEVGRENLRFYGAPHVVMLFIPRLGDGVRAASDLGMYAQNFLLSLHARGYQGIPQAVHARYAQTVRAVLDVPADLKLLFGIAFGSAVAESPLRDIRVGRVPLSQSVTVHDTAGLYVR